MNLSVMSDTLIVTLEGNSAFVSDDIFEILDGVPAPCPLRARPTLNVGLKWIRSWTALTRTNVAWQVARRE
jgi:hypothetical protein